ncbi:hypothetical protein ACRAWD_13485 [Caulobacter segnis]
MIQGPRCLNCPPGPARPTQGDDLHPHNPPMVAGDGGHGPAGMPCFSCHTGGERPDLGPGHQEHPRRSEMGSGPGRDGLAGAKSLGQICAQIKNPATNGGRSLAELHHHMAQDHLVGWAWNPGAGRAPGAGHAGSVRRADQGLDRHRREVPESLVPRATSPSAASN